VLLVGAIIAPLLLLSGILVARFATAERARIAQDGRDTARELASAIGRELLALEATLSAVARAPVLRDGAPPAIQEYLAAVARPLGANITLRDTQSRQVVNTGVPPGQPLPAATSLRAADEEALRTRRPVVSGVYVSRLTGAPVFGVVVPVLRDDAVIYLLSLALPIQRIDEVVATIHIPDDATVGVLDRDNILVAGAGPSTLAPGTPVPAGALAVGVEGNEGTRDGRAVRGDHVTMFYNRLAQSGWLVALVLPARVLDAPLLWSLAVLGGVGVLLTLLSLVLAFLIGKRFSRPIDALAAAATRLGEGVALPPVATSVTEIKQVGDALAAAAIGLREQGQRRDAAEAALRELNTTLEAQVAARTAELTKANTQLVVEMQRREASEGQLRQMQKIEAVGQLTGGIAHDFNNMLAVIIGSLRLLRRRMERGEGGLDRFIDGAIDGADRAAALTHRLLAFSRQQPLAPAQLDANRLTTGMSTLLRRTIPENIKIETVLAGGLWRAHADPGQLENSILNLALNARDAMPDGGRLTIETANVHLDDAYAATHSEVRAGQYVMLAVSDTGAGMTADVIQRAFDPFFTTKPPGQGTGLGLSQVYGFIKQSGGHVSIYSEPGQGTSVKLYLPRFYGEVETPRTDEPAAPVPSGAGATVLVVEDDDSVRALTVEMVRDLGYRVVAAESGVAALRALDGESEVALLLTDVVMPDMNGRKLADAALARRPALKVLFTTGYTRNAIVHNGVLDPGVHLIAKPFTVESLAAKIHEVLGRAMAAS
jgi:signal transduction histidine kinase/CheY-like chemotaxis protein